MEVYNLKIDLGGKNPEFFERFVQWYGGRDAILAEFELFYIDEYDRRMANGESRLRASNKAQEAMDELLLNLAKEHGYWDETITVNERYPEVNVFNFLALNMPWNVREFILAYGGIDRLTGHFQTVFNTEYARRRRRKEKRQDARRKATDLRNWMALRAAREMGFLPHNCATGMEKVNHAPVDVKKSTVPVFDLKHGDSVMKNAQVVMDDPVPELKKAELISVQVTKKAELISSKALYSVVKEIKKIQPPSTNMRLAPGEKFTNGEFGNVSRLLLCQPRFLLTVAATNMAILRQIVKFNNSQKATVLTQEITCCTLQTRISIPATYMQSGPSSWRLQDARPRSRGLQTPMAYMFDRSGTEMVSMKKCSTVDYRPSFLEVKVIRSYLHSHENAMTSRLHAQNALGYENDQRPEQWKDVQRTPIHTLATGSKGTSTEPLSFLSISLFARPCVFSSNTLSASLRRLSVTYMNQSIRGQSESYPERVCKDELRAENDGSINIDVGVYSPISQVDKRNSGQNTEGDDDNEIAEKLKGVAEHSTTQSKTATPTLSTKILEFFKRLRCGGPRMSKNDNHI